MTAISQNEERRLPDNSSDLVHDDIDERVAVAISIEPRSGGRGNGNELQPDPCGERMDFGHVSLLPSNGRLGANPLIERETN